MKTSTRILSVVLAAAFLLPLIQSCKKGENDPGLSLKSRTGRLAGEWNVSEMESTFESNETETETNGDVTVEEESGSESFDGTNVTRTSTYITTYDNEDKDTYIMTYDGSAGKWESEYENYDASSGTTTKGTDEGEYSHSKTISFTINKDGTFTKNENVKETTVYEYEYSDTTGLVQTIESETTTVTEGYWSFMGKNKAADYSNKERVSFTYTSTDETYKETETSVNTYAANGTTETETTVEEVERTDKYTYTSTENDEIWVINQLKSKEIIATMEGSVDYSSTRTETYPTGSGSTTISETYQVEGNNSMSGTMTLTQE